MKFGTTNSILYDNLSQIIGQASDLENYLGTYPYSITSTLIHCNTTNNASTIQSGASYNAIITADSGYSLLGSIINITMGGVDITSTAYSNGIISIASVTGDLIIEIEALAEIIPYLTFSSSSSFTLATYNANKNWDGTLQYCISNPKNENNWQEWNGTNILNSSSSGTTKYLYLRGIANTYLSYRNNNYRWVLTGNNISCDGNIETLLDYATVTQRNHPPMANQCFAYLFYDCAKLIKAPDLCATTLSVSCYNSMFRLCTSLTISPDLPATNLANNCYDAMFNYCTKLTNPPELPATTLVEQCYSNMFSFCSNLITCPQLLATTLANACYNQMFRGCTLITSIPELPATTLTQYCYYGMFQGCTKIKLSTTQIDGYQTPYRIPTTGTGTAESEALTKMFDQTGGTFTGTPDINTIYYTSNLVISATT